MALAFTRSLNQLPSLLLLASSFHPSSDLPISVNNVLVASQFIDAAGAASVEFVGADANFGAQAELAAVIEPRAGIDQYGRAIDAGNKHTRCFLILRDDRIRVM
jgi:hypothetical protein